RNAGKWQDSLITVVALVFYATPLYWLAMMAVLVFTVQLDLLPAFGFFTVGADLTGIDKALDIAKHLILPSLTLA
ncbi:ABC transporter permease subunit, partial [Mycobacterium tuberculosis]